MEAIKIQIEVGLKETTLTALKQLFQPTVSAVAAPAPAPAPAAPAEPEPAVLEDMPEEICVPSPAPAREIPNTELNDAIKAAISAGRYTRDTMRALLKESFDVEFSRLIPQDRRAEFLKTIAA